MKKIFTSFLVTVISCLSLSLTAQNLIAGWSGNGITGDGSKPSEVGWVNASITTAALWNQANVSGGCRFRDPDVTGGYTTGSIKYENSTTNLSSRFLMVRWDGSAYSTAYFAYPVTLDASTTYTFSMDYFLGGSASGVQSLTAGISTSVDNTGQITSQTYSTASTTNTIRNGGFSFTTGTTSGTYYLILKGAWAWFGIANLSIVKNTELLDDLNAQYNNLTLGDVSKVTSNLTLPTTIGSKGVTVTWQSSKSSVVDSLGHVTRPAKYNASATLTATLHQTVDGKAYSLTKTFKVTVLGVIPTPIEIATFNFNQEYLSTLNDTIFVTDAASGFKGKLMNESRIRTIGSPTDQQFNVLDLGSGKGYFDMGQEIGQAIYALSDHTIMGFFRIDETYTNLTAGGNYFWNFSNSPDVGTYKNGFMYGRVNAMAAGLSAAGSPSTATNPNTAPTLGAWHHFAYTLSGTTGTVYVDGTQVAQNTAMLIPSATLVQASLNGTICNWLGRSGWTSDAYLQKTLLYDFRILSQAQTHDDISLGYEGFAGAGAMIDALNTAYTENPDYIAPELSDEKDALSLGDLSAVTSNITLPTKGTKDQTISISWKTTNNKLITNTGIVTRPNYYNYNDTLTATLMKNGSTTTKAFPATVIKKAGTEFTGNLIAKYDFSNVTDSTVTDVAEKQFKGTLKQGAKVITIGKADKTSVFKVLSLGDSIGYFDMGEEIGKVMYNLSDFTVSAYYRVDTAYHQLSNAGNFLFTFSNSKASGTDKNGYLIGALNNQSVSITPGYYTTETGNQAVSFASVALPGNWHHFAYTQQGTTGTLYIDGMPLVTGSITNLPKTALAKSNQLGTLYNWIGRSNFTSDVYLRKTLVYDFRVYSKALSENEVLVTELNVGNKINELELAYAGGISSVEDVTAAGYSIANTANGIKINGLKIGDKVNIFDIAGRQVTIRNANAIQLNAGVYIVKINNYASKVVVK